MLGFLKKFKKSKTEKDSSAAKETAASTDKAPDNKKADKKVSEPDSSEQPPASKKKKKKLPFKRIMVIFLVLAAVGASGFVVYTFYFSQKDTGTAAPVYKKIKLKHVELPEEILKFTFDYFPDLYQNLIVYDTEMNLVEAEILRIDAIAKQYPDQKKIAEKEKKIWEKTRDNLEKSFLKIEKPVKETYVLFRVNKGQGLVQIKDRQAELSLTAKEVLKPVQELTERLKTHEEIPKGFLKSTLYKLKKKFL
jgi:hypothetical protein